MSDFGGGGLLGCGLEFVAGGEDGEEDVDGGVGEGGKPEKGELDEEGAEEFDVGWGMSVDEGGPSGGESHFDA